MKIRNSSKNRVPAVCLFALFATTTAMTTVNASEPVPLSAEPVPTEELKEFGLRLQALTRSKNVLQRRAAADESREFARTFEGRSATISVRVERVTEQEVFVEIRDPGKIRAVLRHSTAQPYGNLRTVYYQGGPATDKANLMSTLFTLRIGQDIDYEAALPLRDGDQIDITGTIEQMILHIEGWFNPQGFAVIGDWTAVVVE